MSIDIRSASEDVILSRALQSERDAAALYKKLKQTVKNFVMKEKLQFLVTEEKRHAKMIEALLEKLFPGREPMKGEKSLLPRLTLALTEDMTVPDMLELAMEAEQVSEEVYDALSQEADERGAQEIFQYLASMEHGHYSLLKGEFDLCMKDEMYYQRDDFQYDMVHIGP